MKTEDVRAEILIAKIRQARKKQKRTQETLADTLGMSQGDYSRFERRGNQLLTSFIQWADTLGYEVTLRKKHGPPKG